MKEDSLLGIALLIAIGLLVLVFFLAGAVTCLAVSEDFTSALSGVGAAVSAALFGALTWSIDKRQRAQTKMFHEEANIRTRVEYVRSIRQELHQIESLRRRLNNEIWKHSPEDEKEKEVLILKIEASLNSMEGDIETLINSGHRALECIRKYRIEIKTLRADNEKELWSELRESVSNISHNDINI